MLDGKQITDNSRQFLMSWKASREAQQTREKSRPDFNDISRDHGGKLSFISVVRIEIEGVYRVLLFCLFFSMSID